MKIIVDVTTHPEVLATLREQPGLELITLDPPALAVRAVDAAQLGGLHVQRAAAGALGSAAACTGRLSNRIHSFFVETGEVSPDFKPEPGMTVALKTPAELAAMLASGP